MDASIALAPVLVSSSNGRFATLVSMRGTDMSKYGEVARMAADDARLGGAPKDAWGRAAERVFPSQSSQDKVCPRCAFLGLAEEGLVVGIPRGKYTNSADNKRYAIRAVELLREQPHLSDVPGRLWRLVVQEEPNPNKVHNDQMDVVVSLWKNGDIERRCGA